MARTLVTGARGRLGPYLAAEATALGAVITSARSGGDVECDLTDGAAVASLLDRAAPSLVLHAAAMTDVDACEVRPDEADAANRQAVEHLVRHLPAGARLIVISTDQVYPDTAGPHLEDETGPVNIYGKTKLAGEQAALEHPGALVLRTNFFGPPASLSDFFLDAFAAGRPVPLFEDVAFSPLHAATLARLALAAVRAGAEGVYNLGSRDGMTKAEFARALAAHAGLSTATARVARSTLQPGRAPRPRDLRMDVARFEARLSLTLPTLAEEIATS